MIVFGKLKIQQNKSSTPLLPLFPDSGMFKSVALPAKACQIGLHITSRNYPG